MCATETTSNGPFTPIHCSDAQSLGRLQARVPQKKTRENHSRALPLSQNPFEEIHPDNTISYILSYARAPLISLASLTRILGVHSFSGMKVPTRWSMPGQHTL